jgi:hypothetical protein
MTPPLAALGGGGSGAPAGVIGDGTVFYTGRRHDLQIPAATLALNAWEVLPVALGPVLDAAARLTIADPMSFPFDTLRDADRDIPLAVMVPGCWDADTLVQLLGGVLFDHLTPFDRLLGLDDATWGALRDRYSWPARVRGDRPESDRPRKAAHRALRAAVLPQLEAARAAVPPAERTVATVLADHIDHWASLLPIARTDVLGFDPDRAHVEQARRSFPEWRFETALPAHAPEVAHVALSINALAGEPEAVRCEQLAALFATLRVGGRLIVADRFLDGRSGTAIGAATPAELLVDIREASARHLVLEHVESLRLPGEDLTSVGVLAFTKLGLPVRA